MNTGGGGGICSPLRTTTIRKLEKTPNDLRLILDTQMSKVSCMHCILTPLRHKFSSDSLYKPISTRKVVENRKCTE